MHRFGPAARASVWRTEILNTVAHAVLTQQDADLSRCDADSDSPPKALCVLAEYFHAVCLWSTACVM
jgi:hypothetical protein